MVSHEKTFKQRSADTTSPREETVKCNMFDTCLSHNKTFVVFVNCRKHVRTWKRLNYRTFDNWLSVYSQAQSHQTTNETQVISFSPEAFCLKIVHQLSNSNIYHWNKTSFTLIDRLWRPWCSTQWILAIHLDLIMQKYLKTCFAQCIHYCISAFGMG